MFYIIQFNNMESEETKRLIYSLHGWPNGYMLSSFNRIYPKTNNLHWPENKWIVWLDEEKYGGFEQQCDSFLTEPSVKSFKKIDIQKSIHDKDWLWEDDYINNNFKRFLN